MCCNTRWSWCKSGFLILCSVTHCRAQYCLSSASDTWAPWKDATMRSSVCTKTPSGNVVGAMVGLLSSLLMVVSTTGITMASINTKTTPPVIQPCEYLKTHMGVLYYVPECENWAWECDLLTGRVKRMQDFGNGINVSYLGVWNMSLGV